MEGQGGGFGPAANQHFRWWRHLASGRRIEEPGSDCHAVRCEGMARPPTGSEMSEPEMAALLLKAQEEERLGQVTRCDDPGELREFLADIRAHRV